MPGVQHKYAQTCLVFPSAGQTCHAYCSFCFRWPQFVGIREVADKIWLVSFLDVDLGFFDEVAARVEPGANPFASKVLTMCPV